MAQIPPQYEECKEFMTIAAKVVDKYPSVFTGIDVSKVGCVCITNKERREEKPRFDIKTAVPPLNLFSTKDYIVVIFQSDWEAMNGVHKALLVADAVRSISPEGEGKKVPFDMKDHSIMLRTFGVDYLENPDAPDILKDEVNWRI